MRHLIILLLFLFAACTPSSEYHFVNYEKISHKVTFPVMRELEQKYGLISVGIGGGMMGNIREISIGFDLNREVDLLQARELLVNCVQIYLKAINDYKVLRPYLREYPYTAKGVRVEIWVHKRTGAQVDVGSICFIRAVKGILSYEVQNIDKLDPKNEFLKETYEEALKAVESQREEIQ